MTSNATRSPYESLKRNSLSESKTSRSEGTVCRSEFAGSAMHDAWLSFDDARLGLVLRFRSFFTFFLSAATVRTSTPVLGPRFLVADELTGTWPTLSAFRSFTVNLKGGLYTTCSLTLSFLELALFVAVVLVAPAPFVVVAEAPLLTSPVPVTPTVAALLSFLARLPTLRDFEPVSLLRVTCL